MAAPAAPALTSVLPFDPSTAGRPWSDDPPAKKPPSPTPALSAAAAAAAAAKLPQDPNRPASPPTIAWDSRDDIVARTTPKWRIKLENCMILSLAVVDNILSYVTFFELRAFDGRLYNLTDLRLALLPGLDVAILIFAILGTASFVALLVLVECCKYSLYHELMNFRLLFSAFPCSVICIIILYSGEDAMVFPFVTLCAILCMVLVWCLHMRAHYSESLRLASKISLDVSSFLAFVLGGFLVALYCTGSLDVLTKSDQLNCPFAKNNQMPVQLMVLDEWYCAPWDEDKPVYISRPPANSVPRLMQCTDSFVGVFGVSIRPHRIECPVGCLRLATSSAIVGCGTFAVDSPVCMAAIHAGALTDAGGITTVYGRAGLPEYDACSRFSLVSEQRTVTPVGALVSLNTPALGGSAAYFVMGACSNADGSAASTVYPCTCGSSTCSTDQRCTAASSSCVGRRLQSQGVSSSTTGAVPQAFHFNNLPETREFLHLKSFEEVSTDVVRDEPWTRMIGTVSLRVAGVELMDEPLRLGDRGPGGLFAQAAHPCVVGRTGVLCRGNGAAVAQLDFCRPELKKCLEERSGD